MTGREEFWLIVEGGGTKTRTLLVEPGGKILTTEVGQSASPLYLDREKYTQDLLHSLKRIHRVANEHHADVSAAGLAGPLDAELVTHAIHKVFGPSRVIRFRESEAALGYYGLPYGCVLIAGTGSSCQLHAPDGRYLLGGGLGPQFGDEGSCYWIAREAIALVLRTFREGPDLSPLATRLQHHFGLTSPIEILGLTHGNGFLAAPLVAGFAREVFALAEESNPEAIEICARAGEILGELAAQTIQQLQVQDTPIPVVCSGGVFHAGERVTGALRAVLNKRGIQYTWYEPVLEPAIGLLYAMRKVVKPELK